MSILRKKYNIQAVDPIEISMNGKVSYLLNFNTGAMVKIYSRAKEDEETKKMLISGKTNAESLTEKQMHDLCRCIIEGCVDKKLTYDEIGVNVVKEEDYSMSKEEAAYLTPILPLAALVDIMNSFAQSLPDDINKKKLEVL